MANHRRIIPNQSVIHSDQVVVSTIIPLSILVNCPIKEELLTIEAIVEWVESTDNVPFPVEEFLVNLRYHSRSWFSARRVVDWIWRGQGQALVIDKHAAHHCINCGCLVTFAAIEGACGVSFGASPSTLHILATNFVHTASGNFRATMHRDASHIAYWNATKAFQDVLELLRSSVNFVDDFIDSVSSFINKLVKLLRAIFEDVIEGSTDIFKQISHFPSLAHLC